ncbi:hypothetical protein [Oleiharenicola sp. Vm1]|uniref:hypothetical protein n=1 Tax=Oleiharenicola sp. Vm1 TaxID=3398393 RepID=UPI0039F5BE5C
MKWIVLAIVIFVIGYTLVNIFYRKPGPAFRPYEDMNKRATTVRLLNAGWQKLPVELTRPADKPGFSMAASVARGGAGLGPDLEAAFAEKPRLLATIDKVTAPTDTAHGAPYAVFFTASLTDQNYQVGHLEALLRGNEIVLIPTLEKLPNHLLSRWEDADYLARVPTDRLPPGRYTIRLAAKGPAAQWTFSVR